MSIYYESLCEDDEGDSHAAGYLPDEPALSGFPSTIEGAFPFSHEGQARPTTNSKRPFSEPVVTVTRETTVLRTSFLTVQISTQTISQPISRSTTYSSRNPSACKSRPLTSGSSSQSSRTASHAHSSASLSSTVSTEQSSITLPLSSRLPSQTSIRPMTSSSPVGASTKSTSQSAQSKHAIIGGLSGAIAGLAIIGILFCWCLRRRRGRRNTGHAALDDCSISSSNAPWLEKEKIPRPTFSPFLPPPILRSNLLPGPKPLPLPPPPPFGHSSLRGQTATSTPNSDRARESHIDGSLIRVRTDRWPRPFAAGESFRESMGPSSLRVTNPDLYASSSPNLESGRTTPQRIYAEAAARLRETLLLQKPRILSSSPRPPSPAHVAAVNTDAMVISAPINMTATNNSRPLPPLPRVANFSRPQLNTTTTNSSTTTTTTISSTAASIPIAIARSASPLPTSQGQQHQGQSLSQQTPEDPFVNLSSSLHPATLPLTSSDPSTTSSSTNTQFPSTNNRIQQIHPQPSRLKTDFLLPPTINHARFSGSPSSVLSQRTSSYRIPSTASDPFDLDPLSCNTPQQQQHQHHYHNHYPHHNDHEDEDEDNFHSMKTKKTQKENFSYGEQDDASSSSSIVIIERRNSGYHNDHDDEDDDDDDDHVDKDARSVEWKNLSVYEGT